MNRIETKNKSGKVFCVTEYDQDNNWISANWEGFITVDDIKTWADDYLKILNKTRCSNFLNNNKELQGPWQQANEWIATELTPKVIASGLKNYAHVVSSNIFAELSAKDLVKKIEGIGFIMKTFKDESEAQSWLKSLNN